MDQNVFSLIIFLYYNLILYQVSSSLTMINSELQHVILILRDWRKFVFFRVFCFIRFETIRRSFSKMNLIVSISSSPSSLINS